MPSIHPRMSPLSFFHRSWFLYDTIDCNEGMGVINAPSLDTCVENAGTAALQVMHIFLQIAKGLQYVHACGLIHRDLKPANCFLMGEGTVKIGCVSPPSGPKLSSVCRFSTRAVAYLYQARRGIRYVVTRTTTGVLGYSSVLNGGTK